MTGAISSRAGVEGTLVSPYQVQIGYGAPYTNTGSSWFGPLQPIAPGAPPEVAGRQWDYPSGYNLQTRPRVYSPISFEDLRRFADGYDLLRLVLESRKDQVARMKWSIKQRDTKAAADDPVIAALTTFLNKPDGINAWPEWVRQLLEEMLVIDAASLYCQRNRGGQLINLMLLDGATIKPVIDNWGRRPVPFVMDGKTIYPVAYQQVLKGFPAVDYSVRDLIYRPRNPRVHRAYGFSPVEQVLTTVNIALRRQVKTLEYFTSGTVPDALMSVPDTWTTDQIAAYQKYWDSLFADNLAELRRVRFVPGNTLIHQTSEPQLKGEFDEWLARIICYAFSVSPQPFIKQMNRASGETQKEISDEEGLSPILDWIKGGIDEVIASEFGRPDIEFGWQEDDEVDQASQQIILTGYATKAAMTINEVRGKLGLDPYADPAADKLMVLTSTGYVPIDANTIEGKQANIDAFGLPPPPLGHGGAAPNDDGGGEPGDNEYPKGEVGKAAASPFSKAAADWGQPIPYPRPTTRSASESMQAAWQAIFARQAQNVSAWARRMLAELRKDDAEDRARRISGIIDGLDLSLRQEDLDEVSDTLRYVASDSASHAFTQIGVGTTDEDLFEQLNRRALEWSTDYVGGLISGITETTRYGVRSAIVNGLQANLSNDDIAKALQKSYGFSDDRAKLIAHTEIANANSKGALIGYRHAKQSGAAVKKGWLTAGDNKVDEDICRANERQGAIDLDEVFQSGDSAPLGHPRCRCALVPVVVASKVLKGPLGQARDVLGRWTSTIGESTVHIHPGSRLPRGLKDVEHDVYFETPKGHSGTYSVGNDAKGHVHVANVRVHDEQTHEDAVNGSPLGDSAAHETLGRVDLHHVRRAIAANEHEHADDR